MTLPRENNFGHYLQRKRVFFNDSSNLYLSKMTLSTGLKEKVSIQYAYFYDSLNYDFEKIAFVTGKKEKPLLQYGSTMNP